MTDEKNKDKLIEKVAELELVKKELERRQYTKDLFLWNQKVMGVEDERGAVPLSPFHKELCEFIIDKKTNKKLLLVPRGHLKSTLVTVGYSLMRIAEDPTVRIMIANATYDMACSFVSQIKKHLTSNDKFRELYGDLATGAEKWSENMITVPKKGGFGKKEATVTAYGIGGNLVSQHYDVIIGDDVVNRDFINTQEQIEKTILFYKDSLDLLEPGGTFIIIGTRWHDADLYGWILDQGNPEQVYKNFDVFIRQAYKGDLTSEEDLEVLFPDKYNKDVLRTLKTEKGPYEFCLPAEAPILMSDFTERNVEDIREEDEVVGFVRGEGVGKNKLVKSKVKRVTSFYDDVYELTMKSGRKVQCTKTHRWYTGRQDETHKAYAPARAGSKLMKVFDTGSDNRNWYYLAGMFDADGTMKSGGNLNITQGIGNKAVIEKIKANLNFLDIEYNEIISDRSAENKNWKKVSTIHLKGGNNLRVKMIRNADFGKRDELIEQVYDRSSRFVQDKDEVVSVKKASNELVYGFETETDNYVAYGYASANSTQYMNDPIPAEKAKFRAEWFKQTLEDELRDREYNFFTMVDPAIGQRKTSDKTAIVTIAIDQYNNWFVVNVIWDNMLPSAIIDNIFHNWESYHPKRIGVEMVSFQKSLQYALTDEMRRRNIFLPIVELKAEKSKRERIEGLIPRYANSTIYHLTQCPFRENLEEQLLRYPVGKHDDIIDALAYGLQIGHPARKKPIGDHGERNKRRRDKEYIY